MRGAGRSSHFRSVFVATVAGAALALGFVFLLSGELRGWFADERLAQHTAGSPESDTRRGVTGFADAVARAIPSVVSIYSNRSARPGFCRQAKYRDWCDKLGNEGVQGYQSALGSGVVVRADGHILTNDHVISGADEVLVGIAGEKLVAATVVGRDPDTDLAVLRIDAGPLVPIAVASSAGVQVGDIALAIGNPFGIGQTVSQGIVSATGRTSVTSSRWGDFMQTDAAINPGNSGGALINTAGALIGINTRVLSRSMDAQGIGFAIPSDLALGVMESLIRDGRVRRGWLGVEMAEYQPGDDTRVEPGKPELRITSVEPDGPAGKSGIRAGDYLLAIDDQMPMDAVHLGRIVASQSPGAKIRLTIERDQVITTIDVIIEERPPES